jgi:cytochrome d ubiquinol oxidase subunit I
MVAYAELEKLRAGDRSPELLASFEKNQKDLGYGLLLKKYAPMLLMQAEQHIQAAVKDTIPNVTACFSLSVQWLLLAS